MKVSVIIPVYNAEKYLERTLRSLENQTFKNFDIIIINDGSTDSSLDIIKNSSLIDRIIYHYQENSGVSVARNKGIELSRSDFVSFLDSDDVYHDSFLQKMVEKVKQENADIAYCGYNLVYLDRIITKKSKFIGDNFLKNYILENNAPSTNSWMIRRSYIEQFDIRFLEGISWGEDFEFFCSVLSKGGKISSVQEYLTDYTIDLERDTNLSSYSLSKIDKDYESIVRISNIASVRKDSMAIRALFNYRLPALISYNIKTAISLGFNSSDILFYYEKYFSKIFRISYVNGLRSIKLNIVTLFLYFKMFKIKRNIAKEKRNFKN